MRRQSRLGLGNNFWGLHGKEYVAIDQLIIRQKHTQGMRIVSLLLAILYGNAAVMHL